MENQKITKVYTKTLQDLFYPLKKMCESDPEGVKREYRNLSDEIVNCFKCSFSYVINNDSGENVLCTESFKVVTFKDKDADEEEYILYEKLIEKKYSSFFILLDHIDLDTFTEFYNFTNSIKRLINKGLNNGNYN